MAHQVFLSYATEDVDTARLLCRVLEAEEGIRCWIAPRDVEAGTDYAAAILDAIKDSALLLLLFSSHANASPYVLREIERAIAYERPVLCLRLDGTPPSPSLEYYLNLWQWLDVPRGIESKRPEIVAAVKKQLGGGAADASTQRKGEPGANTPSPKPAADPLSDERRLVTILFADLAGISSLAESRDPEAIQELLNRCFDLLTPCVERYGGTIDKFVGNGLMALFGAPTTHENDAERAIRAALDIRAAIAEFGSEQEVQLAVHQGISTGRVLAGSVGGGSHKEYSVVGDAVNVAARLQDLAEPNEIIIGPETHGLVGLLFVVEDAGSAGLRGRTEPVRVYRVLGEASSTRTETFVRLRAPLVGRESELRVLSEALERLSQGEGGAIYIAGDAGVGKTRLLEEGHRRAGPARWLEGHAESLGLNVSYQPIREMLETDAGWSSNDDQAERLAKLARRVGSVLPDEAAQALRFLAALLGIETPEDAEWLTALGDPVFRRRLHGTIGRYVAQLARRQPLVLAFEDLHWVDTSTATLIEELSPLTHEVPLLLCLSSRPDLEACSFRPERIASRAREKFRWLRLGPLGRTESRELLARLLGSSELPIGLNQLVEGRAEGNPFFIQEILHSLIASRNLEEDGAGGWRLTRRSGLAVPNTLQGVIASRVDRLAPEAREVIRVASVLGRTFSVALLSEVVALPTSEVAEQVRYLEDAEMILMVLHEREPHATFTHALMQEAVYETIPLRDRHLLHQRVAEGVEARASATDGNSDLLAYHYSKSETWDRARHYLFEASKKPHGLAVREVSEYYREAFETLLRGWTAQPRSEGEAESFDWFLASSALLEYQDRLRETFEALQVFHARLAQAFGEDDRRTLAAAEMLGACYREKGMFLEGRAILEHTFDAREVLDGEDDPSLALILARLGSDYATVEEAQRRLTRAIDAQRAAREPDLETLVRLYVALSMGHIGNRHWARAKEVLEEALTIPRIEEAWGYPILLTDLAEVEIHFGLADAAEAHARLGCTTGSLYSRAFCQMQLGFVLRTFWKHQEGLDESEGALAVFEELERGWEIGCLLADIAECRLGLGSLQLAQESARRALTLLREEGSLYSRQEYPQGQALCTLAGVELAQDNLAEAESLLEEAAPLVTAKTWGDAVAEAELLYRRGHLRLKQGRSNEANRDVSDAAALLAQLGGEDHALRRLMLAEWEQLSQTTGRQGGPASDR